jgi:hypothetical protein
LVFVDGVLKGGFLVDKLVDKGYCGYGLYDLKTLT